MVCRRTGCYSQPNICSSCIFWSLQLQHHETIHETATYGSVRPYRESPLLARARRTESFHSYRDFQAFNLSSKSPAEKAAAANGNSSQTEARKATAESSAAERKAVQSTALEVRGTGVTDAGGCCSTEVHRLPENSLDLKRRGPEEENETKAESKKKIGFEGAGFLGRKKVPLLASAPVLAEGGPELPGAASPSPTKTAASPRHRKNDSSCQDYGLWKCVWWQKQGAGALWLVAGIMLRVVGCFLNGILFWYQNKICKAMKKYLAAKLWRVVHIHVWLYVMLQNVVRYLVQNVVVRSCVNVVRHVICCDYFCFGERDGAKGKLCCWAEDALQMQPHVALQSCCSLGWWILPNSQSCLCSLVLWMGSLLCMLLSGIWNVVCRLRRKLFKIAYYFAS